MHLQINAFLSTLSLRRATGGPGGKNAVILYFYPRSPCGERPLPWPATPRPRLFLSTLSLRRATLYSSSSSTPAVHFYPRSPCGERQDDILLQEQTEQISIHALLAESDCCARCLCWGLNEFLSTLSLRRATFSVFASPFSIFYFYPRSPCGERRIGQRLNL